MISHPRHAIGLPDGQLGVGSAPLTCTGEGGGGEETKMHFPGSGDDLQGGHQ